MDLTPELLAELIDPVILERGRGYLQEGRVAHLERVDEGRWQATVEGSETYHVDVVLRTDLPLEVACDCPYEWGPICKHGAAVLLAMAAGDAGRAPAASLASGKPARTLAERLRGALADLSPEAMLDLLVGLALDDPGLANRLLARYETLNDKKATLRLAREILRRHQARGGFLDYRSAIEASRGLNTILARGGRLLEAGKAAEALPVFQAVLEATVPAVGHADDSAGALSGSVAWALGGLEDAAPALDAAGRAGLFDYLLTEARGEVFSGWDWRWDLARQAAEIVATEAQRARLFALLDELAARHDDERWFSQYAQEQAAAIKLEVIRRLDDEEAALAFLADHTQYESLREQLARLHLERGEIDEARRLAEAWLADPPPRRKGLQQVFQTLLLDVAVRAGDRAEEERLVEALFLETGDFDYYERLKALLGPAAWSARREAFLERVRHEARRWFDRGRLYVAEEMWPALLEYVQEQPERALAYDAYLAPRYPHELCAVYERLANDAVEQRDRSGYQVACRHLGRMIQLGQGERVAAIVAAWRAQLRRHRALRDELNKAFGPEPPA